MELKKGDVVQLKSGGPRMTIENIEDDMAYCKWFEKGDLKEAYFNLESLKGYKPIGPSLA